MKMKKIQNAFLGGVTVFLLIIFTGCGNVPGKIHEDANPERLSPMSQNLTAEIFIDASYSMHGFVKIENSYYIRTLPLLVRSFLSGWPDGKILYNKFGTKILQIKRDDALMATKPKFYFDPAFNKETHIENVITKVKEDGLTIIITDLFQKDADVNLLIEKLNEKYLSKDLAVGILGIKSEFIGIVADVGFQNLNFEYSTNGRKPKEFRPFYVLLLGKYRDVAHYYEMLKLNGLETFPEKRFIVFSSHLVESLASFENSTLPDVFKLKEVVTILGPKNQNKHVKQFIIQGNPESAYFDSQIPLELLPFNVDFDQKELEVEVNNWLCSQNELTPTERLVKGFIIKGTAISERLLRFRVEIIPASFPGNGTYCFEIIIRPKLKAYSIPNWVSEWDMNLNDFERWKQSPSTFNGASTLNFKSFLDNTWQIIYQRRKPMIAKMYVYIKKG